MRSGNLQYYHECNTWRLKIKGKPDVIVPKSCSTKSYATLIANKINAMINKSSEDEVLTPPELYQYSTDSTGLTAALEQCRKYPNGNLKRFITRNIGVIFKNLIITPLNNRGEGLESIGDMSFMNCTSLKDFSFGTNLKRIGGSAFQNTQLTKLFLPEGLKYVGSRAFNTATLNNNGKISQITPDRMYDVHLPSSLKEIGRSAFCNAANIYTKEVNLNAISAGIRSSGTSLEHDCDFWKLHIDGLQPIVMPKEMDSVNVIARRIKLYAKGETTSPPEAYSESRLATKYATALEQR